MDELRDRFRGSILGLAIGDALGYPCEFRTRQKILDAFGPNGVTEFVGINDERWPARPIIIGAPHPPGTYSDDTQMSIALARGLLDAGMDATLDEQMDAVGRRFVEWSRSPENNRAPGSTCMTGCDNLANGVPWREAGVERSKGCGSAMRVAAIGMLWHDDHDALLEVARASSILTHGHDAGIEGAAGAALAVGCAIRGASPGSIYEAVVAATRGRSRDFDQRMSELPRHLDAPPTVALSNIGLGEAWVAEEAVASALYCVHNAETFADAVILGANTDGDSDSIAAIAGSIAGARVGLSRIPQRWVEQVEDSVMLVELSDELYDLWASE